MFRIIVGVLAAFVGFSFGHSIPKWMETRSKSGTDTRCSPSSSSECAHPVRKLLLRRKSVRRFKFGSQKPSKENAAVEESLQGLSRDDAEGDGCSSSASPLSASTQVLGEHRKSKFRTRKALKDKTMDGASDKALESSPKLLLSAENLDNRDHQHRDISAANVENGHRPLQGLYSKSNIRDCSQQKSRTEIASPVESNLQEPVFCKVTSMESISWSPVVEKSKMKKWKMKLMSLRSKAMASEKVWYEKFENEKYNGKLLAASSNALPKKQGKGKENEGPTLANTRTEVPRSRPSSRVGLLVEGSKSDLER